MSDLELISPTGPCSVVDRDQSDVRLCPVTLPGAWKWRKHCWVWKNVQGKAGEERKDRGWLAACFANFVYSQCPRSTHASRRKMVNQQVLQKFEPVNGPDNLGSLGALPRKCFQKQGNPYCKVWSATRSAGKLSAWPSLAAGFVVYSYLFQRFAERLKYQQKFCVKIWIFSSKLSTVGCCMQVSMRPSCAGCCQWFVWAHWPGLSLGSWGGGRITATEHCSIDHWSKLSSFTKLN